jgi:carbon-monoxide dehydrogenase large subunit
MDGVKKVVTGSSCDILFGTCLWDQPPLANGKVRHAGEPVAAVVAETPWQAAEALKKIKVTYKDLPFVLDPIEAVRQDAPLIHEKNGEYRHISYVVHPIKGSNIFHHYKLRKGDVKKGFVDADVVVEDDFEFPLSSHTALEPHAAICRFHHDGSIEMWASNQAPFVLRDVLSDMFKVPASKVRIHIPYLGGGFGGKSDVSIEPLVAYAASFVPGYAVKLVLTRQEVITGSLLGRGMKGHMRLGAKN